MSFFKKKPPTDVVKTTVEHNPDGSQSVTQQFELKGDPRPVRMEVVEALDAALGRLGTNVLHAIDPSRILSFASGGPPVWSVGIVDVPGTRPYSLLVTYGFSHVVSPEDFREGIAHEYSLAVPAGVPLSPWADAFLRFQCRYVLTEGADIRVNDCIPLRGVPMTRIPFQPQHHANLPDSSLVGILATRDPVLGVVATPAGPIEVRRLVGIDAKELDRVETWSAASFLEELSRVDPLLLSPPQRKSLMGDPSFQAAVDRRAAAEGSDIDAAMFEIAWRQHAGEVQLQLPTGQAAKRLLDALRGRVGFGRPLLAVSSSSPPIEFLPGAPGVQLAARSLRLSGDLETGPIAALIAAVTAGVSVLPLR